eukprot:SAG31_NODE_6926_length_1847_cov_1.359268_1_plen_330_part_00
MLQSFGLDAIDPAGYRLLTGGRTLIPGVDDAEEFEAVGRAMAAVGFTTAEQTHLYRMVAAVMLLGEIQFVGKADASGDEIAALRNSEPAAKAAATLSVSSEAVSALVLQRTMSAGGAGRDAYQVPLKVEQAARARDGVAMGIYSRVFSLLVGWLNRRTAPQSKSTQSSSTRTTSIGVLDIFGFEAFESNSLEQLLINYANEKLQQQFCYYVFKLEQDEYEREGVQWKRVDFKDNGPILEVLEGPVAMLSLLEEEARIQRGTDGNFVDKLRPLAGRAPRVRTVIGGQPEAVLWFDRRDSMKFMLRHYAGPVAYVGYHYITFVFCCHSVEI